MEDATRRARFGVVAGMSPGAALVSAEHICKHYAEKIALVDASVELRAGELVAIVGGNGQGKSTLVRMLALDLPPTHGRLRILGQDVSNLGGGERDDVKGSAIHYIPQNHLALLPKTPLEAVTYVLERVDHVPKGEARRRAEDALRRVGLASESYKHRRVERGFSGGERARVAVATAIARRRPIVLADEILAEVDAASAVNVLALFRQLASAGAAVAMIVHQGDALLGHFDRVLTIDDKRIVQDQPNPRPLTPLMGEWPPSGDPPPAPPAPARYRVLAVVVLLAALAGGAELWHVHGSSGPPRVPAVAPVASVTAIALGTRSVVRLAPTTVPPAAAATIPATIPVLTSTSAPLAAAATVSLAPQVAVTAPAPPAHTAQEPAIVPGGPEQAEQPAPTAPPPPPTAPQTADGSELDFEPAAWSGGFLRNNSGWCGRPWIAVYGAQSPYPQANLQVRLFGSTVRRHAGADQYGR